MRYVLNAITLLAALLSLLLIGNLIYGVLTNAFDNGQGMAILAFQLLGSGAAIIAIVTGLIGVYFAKKTPTANLLLPKAGAIGGGISLLALILMLLIL